MDDEALLSQPIKELVGRLASVLRQEAQSLVEEHQTKHQSQVRSLTDRIQELESSLANTNNTLETKERELKVVLSGHDAKETLKANAAKANQANEKLQVLLAEKQAQIESLEEKHRHNREAMEHYRQSVKDQREQDQRKHEHQVQQLQAEIRTLNQTLSVKQGDITQLNKDNGRLAAELGATQKTVAKLEAEQRKLITNLESKSAEVESLKTQLSELEKQSEELDKLKRLNEELLAWKAQASVSIGKLETEISIKTEMMNRLLEERSKTPEASG